MRSSQLATACFGVVLLAVIVSCNGLVVGGRPCGGAHSGGASGFCDDNSGAEAPPMGTFPGPGSPPFPDDPNACSTTSIGIPGPPDQCILDRGPWGSGEVCRTADDCPSECCIADDDGRFHALLPSSADAGTQSDASTDAAMSGDADAAMSADAEADAGTFVDAGPEPRQSSMRTRACSCGVCLRLDQACATLNAGKGLGGP